MITQQDVDIYRAEGGVTVRGLFSLQEVDFFTEHYMRLRAAGEYAGDFGGVDTTGEDPLKKFPRMIHMHRWDEPSMKWMVDPRLGACMTALLGREPFAVQTMLYFKPAGSRGQALHQDQYYLRVRPGTCMAAWMALDDCDEENGCLQVVPGSHDLPLLCTTAADISESFTDITVPIPAGMEVRPVVMKRGDVFFFNGTTIHGSYPNRSRDRFRRALIGHYVAGEAEQVGQFYHPVYRMDGSIVDLGVSQAGGPCGIWVEQGGRPVVEMTDRTAAGAGGSHG